MESNLLKLWYQQPANAWTKALPLGNGRLGAMIYGGVYEECLSLNEDTLWSGYPRDLHITDTPKHYQDARDAVLKQNYAEAEKILETNLLGSWSQSYLPLGDLKINFNHSGEFRNYQRSLDLGTACHLTSYEVGDTQFTRQTFISTPHNALFVHLKANGTDKLNFTASLTSQLKYVVSTKENILSLDGQAPSHVEPNYVDCLPEEGIIYYEDDAKKGMRFGISLKIILSDGQCLIKDDSLSVEKATSAAIILCAQTSFNGYENHPYLHGKDYKQLLCQNLDAISDITFEEALTVHVQDYKSYFDRVSLGLPSSDAELLPTDQRLLKFLDDHSDISLTTLLFQYGRYLLISSSRPGTQAANLQGIWNKELRAPWSSNYTVNINTEMNYWPAEICNLTEMHEPLFDLINDISKQGQVTAQKYYGANGFVSHHNIDIWRMTTPVGNHGGGSSVYGFWPMSSGWLCTHLYQHYLYTLDKDFLLNIYPILKDAANFYSDLLVQNDKNQYFFPLATSPENSFLYKGRSQSVCETTTMTTAIIKEVFAHYLSSSTLLNIEDPLKEKITHQLENFIPYQIGNDGRLFEWSEQFEECEVEHRHVSHLYPLFPGEEFSYQNAPELIDACKSSLLVRGDDGTGWSLGWKINLWAKLWDGDHALKLIERQLRLVDTDLTFMHGGGGTYSNLFDAHPPFQIDGNFGATSGIAHMLLQSSPGHLVVLPALPTKWANGYVKGLKAKGNVTVDLTWKDGNLTEMIVSSPIAQTLSVNYQGKDYEVALEPHELYKKTQF